MNLNIFHSVNAGLYIWNGTSGLLVDGIHKGCDKGLSDMPKALKNDLKNHLGIFSHIDFTVFTHLHPDHYCKDTLHYLLKNYPSVIAYGPNLDSKNFICNNDNIVSLVNDCFTITNGEYHIIAEKTMHDGQEYSDFQGQTHYSFLIESNSSTLFLAGDSYLSAKDYYDFSSLTTNSIDAGFFNLYQLASSDCQDFINKMKIKRIFLYHLPFFEDDVFNYCKLAKYAINAYPDWMPPVEMLEQMSWIDYNAPAWAK